MTSSILGIDIAKKTFHAALLVGERAVDRSFSNTAKGFAMLATWLEKYASGRVHACMEATGRYGDGLAHWLHDQGHVVSIVNPAAIHFYAKSRLNRNKTDKVDAGTIAQYCQREKPRVWTPPPPEVTELQALCRHRAWLVKSRDGHRNRLSADLPSKAVNDMIQEEIAYLQAQIKRVEALIRQHINAHPTLQQQDKLLQSIPGIGPVSSALLVSLQLHRFSSARAVVAFSGLNPRIVESGSSVRLRSRISKRGDPYIRRTLYFPAVTAQLRNPLLKRQAARLAKAGKQRLSIIAAAMRKLICLAYGVIKSGRPFNPKYPRPVSATS